MNKQKILLEAFERNMKKAEKCVEENNLKGSKENLKMATDNMYELALIGSKDLQQARLERADSLFDQVVQLDEIIKKQKKVDNVGKSNLSPEDLCK